MDEEPTRVSAGEALRKLDMAEKGSRLLSAVVFLAIGGELRRAPISNQSGEFGPWLPYWPDDKHPCMGVSFSTNLGDLAAELDKRGLIWEVGTGRVSAPYRAKVSLKCGSGSLQTGPTPCIALCKALIVAHCFQSDSA